MARKSIIVFQGGLFNVIGDEIELNNENVVWIDSYFVNRTYEELEGDKYDPRANAFVLNAQRDFAGEKWPSIPSVMLRRNAYESDLTTPLPRIAIQAILRSLSKNDDAEDGSHLVVIWLQEDEWPLISPGNLGDLQALNWLEHAVGFSY